MKKILAIIKPFKLGAVQEALRQADVTGITVTEVKGAGRQRGHTETYRGVKCEVDLLPKLEIEIAVENDSVERIIELISGAAGTGKVGDGKIFVSPLEDVVRIRTGERGAAAI